MKTKAKTSPEFDRFNALVGKVLSVPKDVLKQRIAEDRKKPKRNKPTPKA
jgi:hypothetical protein